MDAPKPPEAVRRLVPDPGSSSRDRVAGRPYYRPIVEQWRAMRKRLAAVEAG